MSKQTRKSISLSGELYSAIREYAKLRNKSISDLVEGMMRRSLKMPERKNPGRPLAKQDQPLPQAASEPEVVEELVESPPVTPPVPVVPHPAGKDAKPWILAGFRTRDLWREWRRTHVSDPAKLIKEVEASIVEQPKKKPVVYSEMSDHSFNKLMGEKLEEKTGYKSRFGGFTQRFGARPKQKEFAQPNAHEPVVETPKVLAPPDTSGFDEWEKKNQPRKQVEPVVFRQKPSNIVLF